MANIGINGILVQQAKMLSVSPHARFNERTQEEIKELYDAVMVGNPAMRYITLDARKNNICAQICEMMMVLSGNPDLRYLSLFLPRAKDYSDDNGKTWRGNYGIRIRGTEAFKGENNKSFQFARYRRDNLKRVIDTLKQDPSSRQAFITIGDSHLDRFVETNDTPCTMALVFNVTENNLLRMSTFMRSNDIIFGFSGVNYFIFTCLQELIANVLGYQMGDYTHHSVSLHVYSKYYDTLKAIADTDQDDIYDIELETGMFGGFESLEQFDKVADTYFRLLDEEFGLELVYSKLDAVCPNKNLTAMLLASYAYAKKAEKKLLLDLIKDTPFFDSGLLDRDTFFAKHLI